ncbi:MAG: cupin domain-containing protein [Acidobacteria bacterium]|nr:cupin domain-containing protein [Acidobacteriota bacterium]MBV9623653.1 cupin domain-containing protein [Acidobacteriota bacterium]
MRLAGHTAVAEALDRLERAGGERSIALFEHGTLIVEIYAPRGTDTQMPHTRDEIYVVARGTGTFELNGTSESFAVGDVLFAPARMPHKFIDFTDDFAAWVFFYGPEGGEQ